MVSEGRLEAGTGGGSPAARGPDDRRRRDEFYQFVRTFVSFRAFPRRAESTRDAGFPLNRGGVRR
jgi:hypothetical protein